MLRLRPLRRGRRALGAMVVAAVSLGSLATLATPASASPLNQQDPVPNVAFAVTGGAAATDGLVQGSTVSFTIDVTSPAGVGSVEAKLCKTGQPLDWDGANYGYSGSSGRRCVRQAGITPVGTGLDASPAAGIQPPTYAIPPTAFADPPGTDQGPFTFTMGTGTVTWNNATGFTDSLTCGPGNPCDIVVKVDTSAGDTTWFVQTVTFLAAPAAPVLPTPTIVSGTSLALDWPDVATATGYRVCIDTAAGPPAAFPGDCSFGEFTTGASAYTATGLTPFTPYFITARAENGAGISGNSNEVSQTPAPAGPTIATAVGGDAKVDLTWNDLNVGEAGYRVTVLPASCTGAPIGTATAPANPTFPFAVNAGSGVTLTNGTTYCFSVAADFGAGNFSAESNQVTATPGGAVIYQTINVTRATGTLVISQRCAGDTWSPFDPSLPDFQNGAPAGDFDPTNALGTLTPATRCTVNLSGPRPSHTVNDITSATQRTVQDADVTTGSLVVNSPTASFSANDVGQLVSGTGIPAGTRIVAVTPPFVATLSAPATATFDDAEFSVLGRTITRSVASGGLAAGDVTKSIQGIVIPGGAVIIAHGNVGGAGGVDYFDLDQPANFAGTSQFVRIWDAPPSPARLIVSGPGAGAYLRATGKMNQVYVVDQRDSATAGWVASGEVSQFCDGSNDFNGAPGDPGAPANGQPALAPDPCTLGDNAFSSVHLGWEPKVRFAAGTAGFSVDAGNLVAPISGGLNVKRTLAVAPGVLNPGTSGLGVARIDADFDLLIPVTANGGFYQATLTLDVA